MREGPLLRRCVWLSMEVPGECPLRLVPPLWDLFRQIRFVPCSIRCTGRPRLIPGDGFMRCGTRSSAETSCGVRGSRCSRNDGAPGIDRTTLAEVEEYGVVRLLDELAGELQEGRYRPLAGPAGVHPEVG